LNNDDNEVMKIALQEPKSTTICSRHKKINLSFCFKWEEVQGHMHLMGEQATYFKYGMQPALLTIKTMPALYLQLQLPQIIPAFPRGVCQQLQ